MSDIEWPIKANLIVEDRPQPAPIDMVLHCPKCGVQHIDAPDREDDPSMLAVGITHKAFDGWTNPPHRSHLCHGCGHIWRPADVPTNGVQAVKTKGKNDHFPTHCTAAAVTNMKRLRELLGYVEDGSSEVVHIVQDDATKDWIVRVGKQTYYGRSLESALEAAAGPRA